MTRINSAIPPKHLTDEHLLAEHREIKRLGTIFPKTNKSNIPSKFTLGKGHVIFFIDKPDFTLNRYRQIHNECLARGFNVTDFSSNWDSYVGFKGAEHSPTLEEYNLLIERISLRLRGSSKLYWHYWGKSISKEEAVNILKQKDYE